MGITQQLGDARNETLKSAPLFTTARILVQYKRNELGIFHILLLIYLSLALSSLTLSELPKALSRMQQRKRCKLRKILRLQVIRNAIKILRFLLTGRSRGRDPQVFISIVFHVTNAHQSAAVFEQDGIEYEAAQPAIPIEKRVDVHEGVGIFRCKTNRVDVPNFLSLS